MLGTRPADHEFVPMAQALEWHVSYLLDAGSPTAALIVEAVLHDLMASNTLAPVVPTSVRFGDLPALRIMAAVHRLALDRRAPRVAMHLPTMGGTPPTTTRAQEEFRQHVVDALAAELPVLAASMSHTPQTNEPGRAALLRCALSQLGGGARVRLREIGASAGLNLRADHLPGLPGLEVGPLPTIIDRVGCDRHPIDPASVDGRLTLSSYVWVDDVERFARLGRALAVAERVPATLVIADAVDFLRTLQLDDGTTTVLWHSAFWTYLPDPVRSSITSEIERLGGSATPRRRFAHVSWELPDAHAVERPDFQLRMQMWTGSGLSSEGQSRLLATGRSHGGVAALAIA